MGPLIRTLRGMTPEIEQPAFIAETAALIGNVKIGAESSIWYHCVLRGDGNYIHVGKRTNIQDGTIVHISGEHFPTTIGDDVTIGHAAIIHACTIHDRALIGMGATVMDGTIVESEAVVAAGALVPPGKVVKSGQVWAGNPAKYHRDVRDSDLEFIDRVCQHYWELAQEYLARD
jgi:carbonic anhydrase/acetyltransferase-like protein (isoleucine patch superfamily)